MHWGVRAGNLKLRWGWRRGSRGRGGGGEITCEIAVLSPQGVHCTLYLIELGLGAEQLGGVTAAFFLGVLQLFLDTAHLNNSDKRIVTIVKIQVMMKTMVMTVMIIMIMNMMKTIIIIILMMMRGDSETDGCNDDNDKKNDADDENDDDGDDYDDADDDDDVGDANNDDGDNGDDVVR